jgi:hypothetical protein
MDLNKTPDNSLSTRASSVAPKTTALAPSHGKNPDMSHELIQSAHNSPVFTAVAWNMLQLKPAANAHLFMAHTNRRYIKE